MTDQIHVPGLLEAQRDQPPPPGGRTEVTVHGNTVVLHFEKGCEFAVFHPVGAVATGVKMMLLALDADPAQAQFIINCCLASVDHVYDKRGDIKPASGAAKQELIDRHRRTLTNRIEVMLNSQREKKTVSNHALAKDVVERCLKDVFS